MDLMQGPFQDHGSFSPSYRQVAARSRKTYMKIKHMSLCCRDCILSPFFIIEVQLVYNVVLITAIQQSDSVICICVCILLFCILPYYGLSQDIKYSSLLYSRALFVPSVYKNLQVRAPASLSALFPPSPLGKRQSDCFYFTDRFICVTFAAVVVQSLSRVHLSATAWTLACQAPLSMGFPRQGLCSGLPLPSSPGGHQVPHINDSTWHSSPLLTDFVQCDHLSRVAAGGTVSSSSVAEQCSTAYTPPSICIHSPSMDIYVVSRTPLRLSSIPPRTRPPSSVSIHHRWTFMLSPGLRCCERAAVNIGVHASF